MTDDEMIEELNKRLGMVAGPMFRDKNPWPDWNAVAKECLRQMKWQLACAGMATRTIGPECKEVPRPIWEQWAHIIETGPITLAPPDWSPE